MLGLLYQARIQFHAPAWVWTRFMSPRPTGSAFLTQSAIFTSDLKVFDERLNDLYTTLLISARAGVCYLGPFAADENAGNRCSYCENKVPWASTPSITKTFAGETHHGSSGVVVTSSKSLTRWKNELRVWLTIQPFGQSITSSQETRVNW